MHDFFVWQFGVFVVVRDAVVIFLLNIDPYGVFIPWGFVGSVPPGKLVALYFASFVQFFGFFCCGVFLQDFMVHGSLLPGRVCLQDYLSRERMIPWASSGNLLQVYCRLGELFQGVSIFHLFILLFCVIFKPCINHFRFFIPRGIFSDTSLFALPCLG